MNKLISKMKDELVSSGLYDFEINDNEIVQLYNQYKSYLKCSNCVGLKMCSQENYGYYEYVTSNSPVNIGLKKCKYLLEKDKKDSINSKINLLYVSKKVLESRLENFDLDNTNRAKAIEYAKKFITNISKHKQIKAMYISGINGVGKTFLLGAIANELSNLNIDTMLVYVPDLARNLKSSMFDGSLEEKINTLKEIDVLMLDDIGAEVITSWFRDEVLGPILNYRLQENKATFFSSNIKLDELPNRFSENKENNQFDSLNAIRIYSRIEQMSKEFIL